MVLPVGRTTFAGSETFRRLKDSQLVHQSGRLALAANMAGDRDAVSSTIQQMEQASVDVI